jgi:hypothetical protein
MLPLTRQAHCRTSQHEHVSSDGSPPSHIARVI